MSIDSENNYIWKVWSKEDIFNYNQFTRQSWELPDVISISEAEFNYEKKKEDNRKCDNKARLKKIAKYKKLEKDNNKLIKDNLNLKKQNEQIKTENRKRKSFESKYNNLERDYKTVKLDLEKSKEDLEDSQEQCQDMINFDSKQKSYIDKLKHQIKTLGGIPISN